MDIKKLRKKWDSVELSNVKNKMQNNIRNSQQQQKEFNKKIYDAEIQRRKVELSTKKESPNAFTRTNQMNQYNAPTAVVPNSIENRVNKMYEKIILKQEAEKDVINQAKRMFENNKNIKATLSEEKSSLINKPRADAKLGQEDLEKLSEMDRKGRLEALKGRNEETFQEANLYALTKSNQQTEKKVNEAEGTKKILPTLEYLGKELGQNTVSSFGQIKATAEHIQGRDKNLKALENAQKYQEAISPLGENINSKFIKNLGMATEGLGQQMPQILLGSTGAGALVGGFTEFSNTYNEMTLENPNNKTKTMVTALLKGTVAGGLEHALGLFGGSKIDDLSKSQLAGIKNKLVRNAMATGYDVAGEITEEQLENIIGYVIDKAVNDKNITMEQAIKEAEATFKQTGLTTLLMSALGLGGNTRGEVNNLRDNLDIIEASNISGTEKKNLKEWVSSENVSNDQLYTQIGKMVNENNISEQILEKTVENSQNQQTTMKNKLISEQEQQTTLPQGEMAQNQTSKQPLGNDKYAIKMPDSNYKFEKTGNQNEDNLDESMSKVFNNSEDTKKLNKTLKQIMKDKNLSIVFDENVTDENGNIVDGKYESGVITINPNSTRAFEHIATHELTHAIGTKEMLEMVEKYRQSNSEFNSKVETLLKNYNKTELTEEALAEVSGQLFGTQEFINNVKNTNPNLFQKIYSEIKYLWHQLRGYKNENQFIDDLYYKWTQAYNSKAELNQTTKNLAMDKNNDLNYNKDNNLNLEVNKNDDISIRGEVSQGNAILQGETNKPRDSRQNRENNTIGNGRQSSSTNNGMDKGMFGTELQRDSRSNTKTQPLDNTDNRGTKLSDGMKEYMKDTAIRIDNKLLNVFHNTEADFSVFDRDYIGSNSGDVGFFGEGFYFAKTPGEARTYGSKQMSTYLKVVNPFYFGTLSQLDGKKVKSYNSTILQVRNLVKQFPEIGSQEVAFSDGVTLKDYQEAFDRVYSNANVQKFKSEDYYGNEGYHYKVGFEGFIKEYDTTLDYTEQEVRMDFLNDYIKEETDLPMLYKITDVIQNMYQTKSEAEDGIAGGFSKILEKYGYDGIVVGDSVEHADEFVVFHSEQVKDIKNQNPTSNPDINYLKQGNTEWQEYLEENFKTEGTRTTKEQIRLPEKNVLQENVEKIQYTPSKKAQNFVIRQENNFKRSISNMLGISQYNRNNKSILNDSIKEIENEYKNKGKITEETKNRVFEKMYEQLIKEDVEYYNENKDLKNTLRTTPLYVSDKTKSDITDYADFKKNVFGSVRITSDKENISVDIFYQELSSERPDLFPPELITTSEQLERIAEVSKSIRKSERNISAYNDQTMSAEYKKWAKEEFESQVSMLQKQLEYANKYNAEKQKEFDKKNQPYIKPDVEEIKFVYKNRAKLKREVEKQERLLLLTDREKAIVDRLLKDEMDVEEIPLGYNKNAIIKSYYARMQMNYLDKAIKDYKQYKKQELKDSMESLTSGSKDWKDKKLGLQYSRETAIRNIQDIMAKSEADRINSEIFEPILHNTSEQTRMINSYTEKINELNLDKKQKYTWKDFDGNEIKIDEATLAQLLIEKKIDNEYLNKIGADVNKINKTAETFSSILEELVNRMDDVYVEFGYAPVERRMNYFPHFIENKPDTLMSKFANALGFSVDVDSLPTDIAGRTETFKPRQSF